MVRTKEVQKYQLAQIKRKRDLAAEIQKGLLSLNTLSNNEVI